MSSQVFDASAVMALLNHEPGAQVVRAAVHEGATVNTVNESEVITKLYVAGLPATAIQATLAPLKLTYVDFDSNLAYQAALLRPLTQSAGLSFGDRACLALAQQLRLPVLTADRAWTQVDVGVTIRLIR